MQQLASDWARELGAYSPHLFGHLLGAHRLPGLALAALVEALPAHAAEAAAALRAQGFFGPQAANGRWKDFFGNGMPWFSSTTCSIVRSKRFRPCASFNSLAARRFCARNCVSNGLMRCTGACSAAGAVPGEVSPTA